MPINRESMQVFQVSKSSSEKNSRILRLVRGEKEVENEISLTTDDIVGSYVCVKEGEKFGLLMLTLLIKNLKIFLFAFYTRLGCKKMYWFPQDECEQILDVFPHPKLIDGSHLRYMFEVNSLIALMN